MKHKEYGLIIVAEPNSKGASFLVLKSSSSDSALEPPSFCIVARTAYLV